LVADHVIARHYPEAAGAPQPYAALLSAVAARQGDLVARWLLVGFIHGVMNTDNCSIAGETIDYGPCAFMDAYDPATVFSSIDHGGRYAYGRQPGIAHWNLARLAETLLPLLDADEATAVGLAETALAPFAERFNDAYAEGLRRKLGLARERDGDAALCRDLLAQMAANGADFTNTFRLLSEAAAGDAADDALRALFPDGSYDPWAARWRARLAEEAVSPETIRAGMREKNPAYIPRNHQVAGALAAAEAGDVAPFEALLDVLSKPFEERPGLERYTLPPQPEERILQTFCGT
jgi:uncharacterized protein YdiU (UPF0061 family)